MTKGVSKQLLKRQEKSARFAKDKSDALRQEQRDARKAETLANKKLRKAKWLLKKRGREAELDFQKTFATKNPVAFDTSTYRFVKDLQAVQGVESDCYIVEGEGTVDVKGENVSVRVQLKRQSDYLGWGAFVKSWNVSFWYGDKEIYNRGNLEKYVELDKFKGR